MPSASPHCIATPTGLTGEGNCILCLHTMSAYYVCILCLHTMSAYYVCILRHRAPFLAAPLGTGGSEHPHRPWGSEAGYSLCTSLGAEPLDRQPRQPRGNIMTLCSPVPPCDNPHAHKRRSPGPLPLDPGHQDLKHLQTDNVNHPFLVRPEPRSWCGAAPGHWRQGRAEMKKSLL